VVGGAAVLGLLAVLLTSAGGGQVADAATEQLARQNSVTDITAHSGRQSVVYHSDAAVPTANTPRPDGQPTLVCFSGTWCHICERMAPFAHETASEYTDQLVFVEKSVDEDREPSGRYGVRSTPTFIMLGAVGTEVTRFHGAGDAASFAAAIEQALTAVES
jgi:thiol-disulfide isomerase/thioredoxin